MKNTKLTSKIHRVNYKVIQSGKNIELIHYSEGYLKGYEVSDGGGSKPLDADDVVSDLVLGSEVDSSESEEPETAEEIMIRSSKRAAKNLVRLINSNINSYGKHLTSKFLTLTFADDIKDLDIANDMFRSFLRRLNYFITGKRRSHVKYTAVWELTEAGRIHYHVVLYNIPYIPAAKLNDIWGNGNINIKMIDSYENVGQYVAKYMSKPDARYLDPKYSGKKRYFSSQGLNKPVEITDPKLVMKAIIAIYGSGVLPSYGYEFESEELGLITYKSYVIPDLWLLDEIFKN